jgi:phosphoadenosine phosphosulfate reductase
MSGPAQDPLQESLAILRKAREQSDALLVSFSMGKDSLVLMDIARRTFDRVVGFHMSYIPEGFKFQAELLATYEEIFGVKILRETHWGYYASIKDGQYRDTDLDLSDLPEPRLRDIYDHVKQQTGIELIATGAKRTDGLWRRRGFHLTRHWTDVIYPVVGWRKQHILGYCHRQGIPMPGTYGGGGGGQAAFNNSNIDLSAASILYLWDEQPEDFERLEEHFPHIRAVVWRREWHGNPKGYAPKAQRPAA